MTGTAWFLLVGALLLVMALVGSTVKRLPLTGTMLYLAVGYALGHFGWVVLDPVEHAHFIERVTELGVIVSLFTAGLKLRVPLVWRRWRSAVLLAGAGMLLTVTGIAVAGVWGLGLPLGAAVLLGAVLAPTDPVLASDVQVDHPGDTDPLRFALTGEAGLNDGTAFGFVMLGLGLLGLHPLGPWGATWVGKDLLWAVAGGVAIGVVVGLKVGRLVLYLRTRHREAVGLEEFLGLGVLLVSYGLAVAVGTYGFLAAFAAGVAFRYVEVKRTGNVPIDVLERARARTSQEEAATHPEHAPVQLAAAVLDFHEQLERFAEFALMLLIGLLLALSDIPAAAAWFVPLLLLVIRPLAVWLTLRGSALSPGQKGLVAWFGIRGIGSLYYLFFAATHGLAPALTRELSALVLTVIAASVVLHGVTVTPLMNRYRLRSEARAHPDQHVRLPGPRRPRPA